MNQAQELWWRQARSDLTIFDLLRREGAPQCHLLHYLQMATEKLSKAYLWRSGSPPVKVHTGFPRFLRAIVDRRGEGERIATIFGFARQVDLDRWVRTVLDLAYSMEKLAPAEAGDGPNPEYPWPHATPVECPIDYPFPIWDRLTNTGQGRKLIALIERAIARFADYA